ncbi:MAG TPA: trypsin-like peptidase domain-containing protein [Candidatus Dormibacteraeota bacterium]
MAPPPAWAPAPPPPPGPASIWSRLAAYVVLIAVVAVVAGAGIGWSLARMVTSQPVAQQTAPQTSPITPVTPVTPGTGGSSNGDSTAAVAAKVGPAIVDINTTVGSNQAAGTGMIVSSDGEILTNNHVVSGSTSITVTVQGRSQSYTAHVVGVDISQDIAVIQIDGNVSGLPTVTFANSSSLEVGDQVVAIGNALGRGGAPHATSGQITALDQTITASEGPGNSETLNGMIESDAVIYPGDSGGALVNTSGQVIGMITAGEAQGFRSASDTGYAITSNTAVQIVNRIRAHEQAADLTYGQVGYLGVAVQTLDSFSAAQLGLNVSSGALVTATPQSGTPAASAGITRGSVIVEVGGQAVTSSESLGNAVRSHKPGDRVTVKWINSSGTHTATVSLAGVNP